MQPARVGGAYHRIMFQLGQQRFAFTLGAAQYGVKQGFGPGFFQLVGATHGFTDGCVSGHAGIEQLIEADQQQRLDVSIRRLEGFLQQLGGQRRQARLPTGGAKGQVLGETAIAVFYLIQLRRQRTVQRSLTVEYGSESLGGSQTRVH